MINPKSMPGAVLAIVTRPPYGSQSETKTGGRRAVHVDVATFSHCTVLYLKTSPPSPRVFVLKVNRATQELTAELGRAPTLEELAVATGYTVPQVQDCRQQSSFGVRSLDSRAYWSDDKAANDNGGQELGHGSSPADLLVFQKQVAAWGRVEDVKDRDNAVSLQRELRADLSTALSRLLDDREKECLVLRYGLKDGIPKTLQETSRIMGMNLHEVSEAKTVAIRTLLWLSNL